MVRSYLKNILNDSTNHSFVVFLIAENSNNYVPIWIGPCEGMAIVSEITELPIQRPMTHDLTTNILNATGFTPTKIIISAYKNGIYFALIYCELNRETYVFDARPSDAIALAVRNNMDIFVNESINTIDPINEPEKHKALLKNLEQILPDNLL